MEPNQERLSPHLKKRRQKLAENILSFYLGDKTPSAKEKRGIKKVLGEGVAQQATAKEIANGVEVYLDQLSERDHIIYDSNLALETLADECQGTLRVISEKLQALPTTTGIEFIATDSEQVEGLEQKLVETEDPLVKLLEIFFALQEAERKFYLGIKGLDPLIVANDLSLWSKINDLFIGITQVFGRSSVAQELENDLSLILFEAIRIELRRFLLKHKKLEEEDIEYWGESEVLRQRITQMKYIYTAILDGIAQSSYEKPIKELEKMLTDFASANHKKREALIEEFILEARLDAFLYQLSAMSDEGLTFKQREEARQLLISRFDGLVFKDPNNIESFLTQINQVIPNIDRNKLEDVVREVLIMGFNIYLAIMNPTSTLTEQLSIGKDGQLSIQGVPVATLIENGSLTLEEAIVIQNEIKQ